MGPVALGNCGRRWGPWPGGELWLGGGTLARGLWPGGGHTRTLRGGRSVPSGLERGAVWPSLPVSLVVSAVVHLARGELGCPWRRGTPTPSCSPRSARGEA